MAQSKVWSARDLMQSQLGWAIRHPETARVCRTGKKLEK
jgi:hypothetical protein